MTHLETEHQCFCFSTE